MTESRSVAFWLGLALCICSFTAAAAAPPALLSITTSQETHQAKLWKLGSEHCWVVEQNGRMHRLAVDEIKKIERLNPRFEAFNHATMRNRLRRELGRDYSVVGKGPFVVCARAGTANSYAQLFDQVYRRFYGFFATRGFELQKPEFSLVAIVIDDRKKFDSYCESDGVPPRASLSGYYLRDSNRVVLSVKPLVASTHHSSNTARYIIGSHQPAPLWQLGDSKHSRMRGDAAAAIAGWTHPVMAHTALEDMDHSTIIHETTHQVAFNIGIHSRMSPSPQWVVEGLATAFEAPGIRDSLNRSKSQINPSRFIHFGNYVKQRRPKRALQDFLSSDDLFDDSTLDAYSEAWALTFYILKTRSAAYGKYLRLIAERSPEDSYSDEDRLEDFQNAFGEDIDLFESAYLRFMSRL